MSPSRSHSHPHHIHCPPTSTKNNPGHVCQHTHVIHFNDLTVAHTQLTFQLNRCMYGILGPQRCVHTRRGYMSLTNMNGNHQHKKTESD